MSRSRQSAKQAGARFERTIADWLANQLDDDRIDRLARRGNKDVGDIGWVLRAGKRVVIEAKDCARLDLPAWTREAETERGNADALAGVVVHKRRGVGDPGQQWVTCTLDQFIAIITGIHPEETE